MSSETNGVGSSSSGDLTINIENPVDGASALQQPPPGTTTDNAHPQSEVLPGDSALTKAEKLERHGPPSPAATSVTLDNEFEQPAPKRVKLERDTMSAAAEPEPVHVDGRQKGVASIKKEYLVDPKELRAAAQASHPDDDAAEAGGKVDSRDSRDQRSSGSKKDRYNNKSKGGQNHARSFGSSRDAIQLCKSRSLVNEFAPDTCSFGSKCKWEHDIRKYLKAGKREDLQTFGGVCPIWQIKGRCPEGWRCRFASSHSEERVREDGRKELVLLDKPGVHTEDKIDADDEEKGVGVVNIVPASEKIKLRKKQWSTPKADKYTRWLDQRQKEIDGPLYQARKGVKQEEDGAAENGEVKDGVALNGDSKKERSAQYVEAPFKPSEKRRIYYGPETPVLAPLTTQGNLPFRRLCVSLGAQVTWSEMAMGLPIIQGEKSEWALMKAHESEMLPPKYSPKNIVADYDNSKDFKFGAQIAGNKPWITLKTVEVLTALCPHLRAIDLNCGCPIDLVFRQGAGSALLDTQAKLEKMLRGMNAISGEIPITAKIRMGTKDKHPTAEKLVERLALGGSEAKDFNEGPAGVAAITLHGRSRQQRYTRSADWEYIAQCSSLIKKCKEERDAATDTVREADARDLTSSNSSYPYFIGNGDCYSHVDYYRAIEDSGVDSVMVARGALIKPWIFEEIETNQYLDKSASERLGYIEQFARQGLEYWGSDEIGVGITRRFLLEWLSFSCRYVPLGILEHLPPRLGDRPPAFRGRNELEDLLSSSNYKDWIKISEMFLGPAHQDFRFEPKHKSNSYEIEAEG